MPAKDPAAAGSSPTTPRSRTPAGPGSPPRATSDISIAMHHDRDDDRSRTVHRSRRLRPKAAILHNPKPHSSRTRRQYETTVPTVADRVVQASMKLVLEPIFEADFKPCSYGFRPRRRAHDAIAEIHMFATQGYTWVLEGDITACFDEIDHTALMDRVRHRIGDKRVVGLVKAFLCSGVLSEDGVTRDTKAGTPQGGILSPPWPISPSRSSTSTSPKSGSVTWPPELSGPPVATTESRPTESSGMRIYADVDINPLMPSSGLCRGLTGPVAFGLLSGHGGVEKLGIIR